MAVTFPKKTPNTPAGDLLAHPTTTLGDNNWFLTNPRACNFFLFMQSTWAPVSQSNSIFGICNNFPFLVMELFPILNGNPVFSYIALLTSTCTLTPGWALGMATTI